MASARVYELVTVDASVSSIVDFNLEDLVLATHDANGDGWVFGTPRNHATAERRWELVIIVLLIQLECQLNSTDEIFHRLSICKLRLNFSLSMYLLVSVT